MGANKERRTGNIPGAFFSDAQSFGGLDDGSRTPASPAQDLHRHGPRCYDFHVFCMTCGLDILGLVDQN